ncbi:MAG: CHASE2 domain-containing protein [Candidatus Omnitrophota bacterium]
MRLGTLVNVFKARGYFYLKALFLALIGGTLACALLYYGIFEKPELLCFDLMFKLRPSVKQTGPIAIIEIGEDSMAKIGRWPWSRDWHATLLEILSKHKVKIVGMDILFCEESEKELDAALAEALKRSDGTYLPFIFETLDGEPRRIMPLPIFGECIKGTGHINVMPDPDGVVRRMPLYIERDNDIYPQFAFKMACDYLGVGKQDISIKRGEYVILRNTPIGDVKIPIDANYNMIINWAGPWNKTFKHYSYIDVIVSYKELLDGLKPRVNLDEFKDKICLVGTTAIGLGDIRPIPLEPLYPAIGIHANIIDDILRKDFIRKSPKGFDTAVIMFISILMGLIVPALKPVRAAVFTGAVLLGCIFAAFFLFNFKGIWITTAYPVFTVFFCFISITLYSEVITTMEKTRLFHLATRDGLTGLYVRRHFDLLFDAYLREARTYKRPLSVYMSDIDHFKKFNDTYGHQIGDFVLKEVSRMYKEVARKMDVAGRYGGEEFIMLLPDTDKQGAAISAERLRKTIESATLKDEKGQTYKLTISIGVSSLTNEVTKEELTKKADDALYKSKESGRNKVTLAD